MWSRHNQWNRNTSPHPLFMSADQSILDKPSNKCTTFIGCLTASQDSEGDKDLWCSFARYLFPGCQRGLRTNVHSTNKHLDQTTGLADRRKMLRAFIQYVKCSIHIFCYIQIRNDDFSLLSTSNLRLNLEILLWFKSCCSKLSNVAVQKIKFVLNSFYNYLLYID